MPIAILIEEFEVVCKVPKWLHIRVISTKYFLYTIYIGINLSPAKTTQDVVKTTFFKKNQADPHGQCEHISQCDEERLIICRNIQNAKPVRMI